MCDDGEGRIGDVAGPCDVPIGPDQDRCRRVDVTDDGDSISVSLSAKRYDGEVLLSYDFDVPGD